MKYLSGLKNKNLLNQVCLLPVDLNVKSDESLDSNPRISGILPTIQFLIKRGAKIVILSHRGRPNSKSYKLKTKNYTLRPFAKILSKLLKRPVKFISFNMGTSDVPTLTSILRTSDVLLLENLRFFPAEDKNNKNFAKKLASLGDFYVNDAFGVSHRANASVAAITKFLPSFAGLLLEKEIKNLSLIINPFDKAQGSRRVYRGVKKTKHPFVIILGGAKISDKIELIKNFLNKTDHFLIGGGIANTFIAAQDLPVGDSLYEKEMIPTAKKLLKSKKIILPVDFKLSNRKILDIGPKTAEKYGEIIKNARMIIWNGPMGYIEDKKFRRGSEEISRALVKSKAFVVVGGGETISILKTKNYKLKTNVFISTGGGAMLEYLADKKLPGIEALNIRKNNPKDSKKFKKAAVRIVSDKIRI